MGKPRRPEKVLLKKEDLEEIKKLLIDDLKKEGIGLGERNLAIQNLIAFGLNVKPFYTKEVEE